MLFAAGAAQVRTVTAGAVILRLAPERGCLDGAAGSQIWGFGFLLGGLGATLPATLVRTRSQPGRLCFACGWTPQA